jgi:hypothetical protein
LDGTSEIIPIAHSNMQMHSTDVAMETQVHPTDEALQGIIRSLFFEIGNLFFETASHILT